MFSKGVEEGVVKIPPNRLGEDYSASVISLAKQQYEGTLNKSGDIIVQLLNVTPIGDGDIVLGDPSVHQPIKFESLNFHIEVNEILEGIVIGVEKFGAFLSIGPLTALLHISQIMDDQLEIDLGNKRIIGKTSRKDIKVGTKLSTRVVMMSMNVQNVKDSRIGLTMRQPGLGKKEWIQENNEKK